nr:MAG TPA: hypothetical protein [Bacteriophage sp.]
MFVAPQVSHSLCRNKSLIVIIINLLFCKSNRGSDSEPLIKSTLIKKIVTP